ncbi:MAG: hypothetical protein Q7O66_14525 [Dehalococcoidia bacterium]|nr:hypothetical protein [Dehalococcoidia bacterium]
MIEDASPVVITSASRYLRGIARLEDKLIVLLHLEQIISVESFADMGSVN